MEPNSILSFSTGTRSGEVRVAAPSPVLDLIFSCYYLRGLTTLRREPLAWAEELRRTAPELATAAADLAGEGGRARSLFAVALELGFAADETPRRFLSALPDLPRLLEELGAGDHPHQDDDPPPWQDDPPDAAWSGRVADLLERLWAELLPTWEEGGLAAAQAAAQEVNSALAEHGDVLKALPRHHFSQFEDMSGSLRDSFAKGRLRIVPLAFAEGGGFHLIGDRVTAVGFGLHGERVHEVIERRVAEAVVGAKALADPTRLMLLSLIVRYRTMPMTVGDLANQLSVTQPTVSGHLKLLREAGLITTDKKGNKSFPKPVEGAVKKVLDTLSEALVDEVS
ncbi:MAG TPA: metalloregulator ArsR/SmtB family transcription factor [Trueperaceae bacterium]